MKQMGRFVKYCAECRADLKVTNDAFLKCNSHREKSTNTMILVGGVAAIVGFIIGKGVN